MILFITTKSFSNLAYTVLHFLNGIQRTYVNSYQIAFNEFHGMNKKLV